MKQVKVGNKIIEIIDELGEVTHRIANDGSEESQAILADLESRTEEFEIELVDSDKDMSDLVDDPHGLNARQSLFQ